MNRLIIVGAGGHGKVVADNALKNGYTDIGFVDDYANGDCMGIPIVGTCDMLRELDDGETDFIMAIGNNAVRQKIAEQYDVNWVKLIHPSAQIGIHVEIGIGTVIMAGAIINPCVAIGNHCIINTAAIVEHDNRIGNYVHLSPGVKLSGGVTIGDRTWLGTGVSVIDHVSIIHDAVIGVGGVVVRNIETKGTYVGVPTREIK